MCNHYMIWELLIEIIFNGMESKMVFIVILDKTTISFIKKIKKLNTKTKINKKYNIDGAMKYSRKRQIKCVLNHLISFAITVICHIGCIYVEPLCHAINLSLCEKTKKTFSFSSLSLMQLLWVLFQLLDFLLNLLPLLLISF